MAPDITPRQAAVLNFIAECIDEHGYPPTIQEIGQRFGIASTNGVFDHLKTLERKGFIERSSKARSIRLTPKAAAGLTRRHADALPLVGRVAAGYPLLAVENIEEYIRVAPRLARRNAFCLRVTGDSMIDAHILEGDIIVVDRDRPPATKDIVVALVEDEATVKYYYPQDEMVELRPANAAMSPMFFPAEQVQLQGVVISLQRDLDAHSPIPR
ncbi:MAG: transcriptional repressor LexA [Candidatus Hydrogenedens sp.]|jgi:repressor LexA|nr:transcriptional repressor LexA [Candidatus Hydrogenedens sp.]